MQSLRYFVLTLTTEKSSRKEQRMLVEGELERSRVAGVDQPALVPVTMTPISQGWKLLTHDSVFSAFMI